ncbi:MAG: hypothetical protein J3R72DRAFT_259649 [Linnemannia gamsii]|nr:MAG: hypothetical protein J3R72DRAFT_259649 [Linnemannia gamsii]
MKVLLPLPSPFISAILSYPSMVPFLLIDSHSSDYCDPSATIVYKRLPSLVSVVLVDRQNSGISAHLVLVSTSCTLFKQQLSFATVKRFFLCCFLFFIFLLAFE